ncbi:putative metal-dependent hydrolase [Mucilaginibacter limnophilus]|uniref:Putative metal-dependent hydrolase n=1 Tax=Mucilaginibacter limnophilus TaxID=1932778 RepID=A0A437MRH8_9SPHI|nr:putative metal-dependent hydrolase [Mucilaginibacter limnophilus]RVU00261.1 putative metal-dependent hydrolase [Mucilaginibacter limnophilus]
MLTDEQMRYPIGKFEVPVSYTVDDMRKWINNIRMLPGLVRQAVIGLSEEELDTPYRTGGWSLRQVVHHLADSHMNSIMRFKLALTEDNPVIKPYQEAYWALQPDYRLPVEPSLKMLEGIHQHMVALFESFTEKEWERTFFHPENNASQTLKRTLATYSWHGKHHLAHITETKKRFAL